MKALILRFMLICVLIAAPVIFSAGVSAKGIFDSDKKIYDALELFTDVLAIVKKNYIEDIPAPKLIENALKGMLGTLDPHSQFLDAETYRALQMETEGRFGGLGVEITLKGKFITVISPIQGSPAQKAGIEPGDVIVKIGETSTEDITITDALRLLRGDIGAPVDLTVLNPETNAMRTVTIVRDVVTISSVLDPEIIGENIGYVRVTQFQETTAEDFALAVDSLVDKNISALILDLRNNPGGLLNAAVAMSTMFLPSGRMIVYTEGRLKEQCLEFRSAESGAGRYKFPVAVLVNRGSASASEIVAGALQDWKRAVIIGDRTFGKASVQTIVPVKNECAVRITVAKYFTPKGRSINNNGIQPDIVTLFKHTAAAQDNGTDEETEPGQDGEEAAPDETGKDVYDILSDSQILEAINILNAIRIYSAYDNGAAAAPTEKAQPAQALPAAAAAADETGADK